MKPNILIIGAGISGEIIGREIIESEKAVLIGYLDDDAQKKGLQLNNKPIFGNTALLPYIVNDKTINRVIISIPSAEGKTIKEILKKLLSTNVKIQIVPGYYHILEQDMKIDYPIRDIDVSDLLGKPQAKLDIPIIASYLTSKTILVTGAGGSIGSELCRLIASVKPNKMLLLGRGENSIFQIHNEVKQLYPQIETIPVIANICNYHDMEEVFSEHKPHVVFHAAAHKHVNLMEQRVKEAYRNNVMGSKNLMVLAKNHEVERFVLISTDKAVRPKSVMGASKRICELMMSYYANESKTVFCAVRFGNVLGSRGSVLPLFKEQIKKGGPVTVTHKDVVRYFMTIPEASQLVLQAGGMAYGREIFILDMGEPILINELAKLLIQIYHPNPGKDVKIKYTQLRPGEKLVEELWTPSEEARTSKNKDIYMVYPKTIDHNFMRSVDYIYDHINKLKSEAFKKLLFDLIKSPVNKLESHDLNIVSLAKEETVYS